MMGRTGNQAQISQQIIIVAKNKVEIKDFS